MKYIQKAGFILIIIGAILAVYQLITGEGNIDFIKSTGFYIFVLGLMLTGIGKLLNKKNEKK